jgi:hypothetical protein
MNKKKKGSKVGGARVRTMSKGGAMGGKKPKRMSKGGAMGGKVKRMSKGGAAGGKVKRMSKGGAMGGKKPTMMMGGGATMTLAQLRKAAGQKGYKLIKEWLIYILMCPTSKHGFAVNTLITMRSTTANFYTLWLLGSQRCPTVV